MIDNGDKDDKLITVPVGDPRFKDYKEIKNLPAHFQAEIKNFLETYKNLEGKTVTVSGMRSAREAMAIVEKGVKMYKEKFNPESFPGWTLTFYRVMLC